MKFNKGIFTSFILLLIMGVTGMDAFGGLFGFGNSASWKEEVCLHDGRTIIVERSQYRGGRHEIGQEVPVAEHTISFDLPGTGKKISWSSKYEMNDDRLILLAVDVVNGVPYIVTTPTTCIAYNKWGRPNPPYVFLKYDGTIWQRISLEQFPSEIKEANVVISALMSQFEKRLVGRWKPVPANEIKSINAEAKNPSVLYLRIIAREPLKGVGCPQEVYVGNGKWLGIDWFTSQPSYDACLEFCKRKKISTQYCPCDNIFKK